MTVRFDDGTEYTIEARARDLLAAENAGYDFAGTKPLGAMYAVALGALHRMQRAGVIPVEVDLPKSVDDLAAVADVEAAEGKE
jgi:hypothetical protein